MNEQLKTELDLDEAQKKLTLRGRYYKTAIEYKVDKIVINHQDLLDIQADRKECYDIAVEATARAIKAEEALAGKPADDLVSGLEAEILELRLQLADFDEMKNIIIAFLRPGSQITKNDLTLIMAKYDR